MKGIKMPKTTPEQNKALVLEAFDTLFNKRDYAAAEKFWSPHYIQHSAHIPPVVRACSVSLRAFRRPSNMTTERLWLKGISSWCTDDFRTSASLRIGLPQILCALKTECLPSTGM